MRKYGMCARLRLRAHVVVLVFVALERSRKVLIDLHGPISCAVRHFDAQRGPVSQIDYCNRRQQHLNCNSQNTFHLALTLTPDCGKISQNFFRLRAHAKIRIGLRKEHGSVASYYISCWKYKLPALVSVDKGQIDQNIAIVLLMIRRDSVSETELPGDFAAIVVEQRKRDIMLALREIALADGLR
jgi:hypothetical protein